MSRIQFRQKTESELQAEAAERRKQNSSASKIEEKPSAAVPSPSMLAVAAEGSGFALEGEPDAHKTRKPRKKPA